MLPYLTLLDFFSGKALQTRRLDQLARMMAHVAQLAVRKRHSGVGLIRN
jgi:hypothetical protein